MPMQFDMLAAIEAAHEPEIEPEPLVANVDANKLRNRLLALTDNGKSVNRGYHEPNTRVEGESSFG